MKNFLILLNIFLILWLAASICLAHRYHTISELRRQENLDLRLSLSQYRRILAVNSVVIEGMQRDNIQYEKHIEVYKDSVHALKHTVSKQNEMLPTTQRVTWPAVLNFLPKDD